LKGFRIKIHFKFTLHHTNMNTILEDFFSLIPLITLFSCAIYGLGYFILYFIKTDKKTIFKSNISKFADTIILGFFILIMGFAVVITKGNTFLMVPLLVLVSFGFYNKMFEFRKVQFHKIHLKQLFFFILLFSILSCGMSFLIQFDNRLLINPDVSIYARLAYNMDLLGEEKIVVDPIFINTYPKELFHFFNEWITVFGLQFIKDLSSLKVFILFTTPCLTTLIFFQILSICKRLMKTIPIFDCLLLSTFILLLPGILKVVFNIIIKGSFALSSVLHGDIFFLKMKVIILLSLISLKLYLNKKEYFAIVVLTFIPIIWNVFLPAFLGGLLLMILYQLVFRESLNKTLILSQFFSFAVLFLIIFLNPSAQHSLYKYSLIDYLRDEYSAISYVFRVIGLLILFALPLLLLLNKKFRNIVNTDFKKYLFFILIASFISFALIHKLYNAPQLLNNLIYPLLIPLVVLFLLKLFNKYDRIIRVSILISIFFVIGYAFTFKEKIQLNQEVPPEFSLSQAAYIATDLSRRSIDPFFYYIRPYAYLMLEHQHWLPQRIDLFDNVQLNSYVDQYHYIENSSGQSFFKYANLKYDDIHKINTNALKLAFLRDYKFKYLLVYKDQLENNRLAYLKEIEIAEKIMFDKNVVLLKLKWD